MSCHRQRGLRSSPRLCSSPHLLDDARVGAKHRARGIVLLVALLVLVVLGLASVALVRAVDTTTLVAGHLSTKQAAFAAVDRGIEHALDALWAPDASIADRTRDDPAHNYYACVQGDVGRCVAPGSAIPELPAVLASTQALVAAGHDPVLVPDDAAGHRSVYVIERLCLASGPVLASHCNLPAAAPAGNAGTEPAGEPTPAPDAFYRVSVKVTGPRNTVAHAQAVLRPPGATREPRVSWRLVTAD